MKTEYVKRKSITKNQWLWRSLDGNYISEYFSSPEERDSAFELFIKEKENKEKEFKEYIKTLKNKNE